MKILGLIPARAGSKGVPGKNSNLLVGQSLVERAYRTALISRVLDRIILSTDDIKLLTIAKKINLEVPFIRPKELATDSTSMIDVVLHALGCLSTGGYHPTAVLLLQPTSPLRTVGHILQAVAMLEANDSVCSVIPLPLTMCPHYVMRLDGSGNLVNFLSEGERVLRRQDVPQAYVRDGTIYLTKTSVLLETRSFYGNRCIPMVMASEDSLSIDTVEDWQLAEYRLRETSSREDKASPTLTKP